MGNTESPHLALGQGGALRDAGGDHVGLGAGGRQRQRVQQARQPQQLEERLLRAQGI